MNASGRGPFSLCREDPTIEPQLDPVRCGNLSRLPDQTQLVYNAVVSSSKLGPVKELSDPGRKRSQQCCLFSSRSSQKATAYSLGLSSKFFHLLPKISLQSAVALLLVLLLFCGRVSAEASAAGDNRPQPSLARMRFARHDRGDVSSMENISGGQEATGTPDAPKSTKKPTSTKSGGDTTSSSQTPKSSGASGHTAVSTTTSDGLITAPTTESAPLPSAFDTGVGNNFTTTDCQTWFESFVLSKEFVSCYPLSLLLQTSLSFFHAEKSVATATSALDASCSVNVDHCTSVMNDLAAQLQSDQYCAADLAAQNPVIVQALDGFIAYKPTYQAGCMKDDDGSYCFADAVTNFESPTDSYVYNLPLGISLPAGTRPTCNKCLKQTMNIFRAAAANSTQPVSQIYVAAAQQVNLQCGPTFINASVTIMPGSTASTHSLGLMGPLITLFALVWALSL